MKRFSLFFCLIAVFLLGISSTSQAAVTNVALGGTATMSNLGWSSSGPELAIDGNTEGNWYTHHLVIASAKNGQTWWQVDLRKTYTLDSIVIWNRTDYGPNWLNNFYVQVNNANGQNVWTNNYYTNGGYPNPNLTISLPSNISGEFVKIGFNSPTSSPYLQLAEVQVYGTTPTPIPGAFLLLGSGLAGLAAFRKKFGIV